MEKQSSKLLLKLVNPFKEMLGNIVRNSIVTFRRSSTIMKPSPMFGITPTVSENV